MAVEGNINNEEDHEARLKGVAYMVLILFPIILFIVGVWNLYLAREMGSRMGQSLHDLFESWREGLDVTKLYSHSYLMTARRFSNAVWQLSAAVITSGAALALTWIRMAKKDSGGNVNKTRN